MSDWGDIKTDWNSSDEAFIARTDKRDFRTMNQYSEEKKTELFNLICGRIAKGESLRAVLKDEDMPTAKTFYEWLDEPETERIKQYARATELRAECIFEDIMNIADAVDKDVIEMPDGTLATNHNVIARDRLRVDSRKWFLSKIMPKKYGDSLKVESDVKLDITAQPPTFIFKNLNEKE